MWTVNASWKYHRNIYDVPLFISLIIFSAGSSRSSPVLSIGMTPAPQAPQQPQMHQPRGFNLGGYVLIRIPWVVDAVELSKEKQALFFSFLPFFPRKAWFSDQLIIQSIKRKEKKKVTLTPALNITHYNVYCCKHNGCFYCSLFFP